MPFQPFTIPENFAQGGDIARDILVPDGDYLFEVEGVKPSPESVERGFFSYRLKLIDGPSQGLGKTYPHLGSFGEKSHWTHNLLLILGLNAEQLSKKYVPNYDTFKNLAASIEKAIKGKKGVVSLAEDTYDGKTRSRAFAFAKAETFVKREAAPAPAQSAAIGKEISDILGGVTL